jgi:L-ascorbate metabolism protein UlaG (beta-lactamase superfamily)
MRMIIPILLTAATPTLAQDRIPSHCLAFAEGPERAQQAAFGAPLAENRVRIRYLNHSSFAIETPGGLVAVTDYTGYTGAADVVPDVATMNNAHSTHWTASPDPRIPHVLKGWAEGGEAPFHEIDLGEMLVRNVSTDVRSGGAARIDGNSIFIFEVAGLCIGHLGHLHHEPAAEDYAQIGRIDVLMVPVDGGYTMDLATMSDVVRRLRSSVVLPMHWFSGASLDQFLAGIGTDFAVEEMDQPDLELSLQDLPVSPTIMVLQPAWID